MQRILRDQARQFVLDARATPQLRVEPEEVFEIETWDAASGFFKSEADKAIPANRPGFDRIPAMANPLGGPVFVNGAERGDTLVVHIEEILVADYSWIAIGPRRGPLGESTRWPELSGEYTTKILRHTPGPSGTMRDGTVHFNERISWPVTPFIGAGAGIAFVDSTIQGCNLCSTQFAYQGIVGIGYNVAPHWRIDLDAIGTANRAGGARAARQRYRPRRSFHRTFSSSSAIVNADCAKRTVVGSSS